MQLTKEYLFTLPPAIRKLEILKEYIKCKQDIKYCIETYFTILVGSQRIPLKLFPYQRDVIDAYENYTLNITSKTRQTGFSTLTSCYLVHKIIFNNFFKVVVISKTLKDSKDFLKMIKDILNDAREKFPWLIPGYEEPGGNRQESITLSTGSLVKAEAATEDSGRGTPGLTAVVVDECAFIDRKSPNKMSEIWSAVSPALASVKGKAIIISTPKGSSGWYYDTFMNAKKLGFNVISCHWTLHPIYNKGTYQWIQDETKPEGGYLKFYNEEWPETIFDKDAATYIEVKKETYPFIIDGKVRSPWYDLESSKLGERLARCELDCVFVGTGGEVLSPELLRDLKIFADSTTFSNPFSHLKGIYTKYKEYKPYNPAHKYILSADVATGDGEDYSAFTVIDITALEVVATYKDQPLPSAFAAVIFTIGKRYGGCVAVIENAGGGGTTLQDLKVMGYNSIYYSTLQKKDPSTGMKKRKIGLWPSEDVRWQGGDKLEDMIRLRKLIIPCADIVEEAYTWIWDKDGKRRHAPQKNDDLLMALQHGVWYAFYVYNRAERNRKGFKNIFEVRRNGETVSMTDNLHGRGTIVADNTRYLVSGPTGSNTTVSGNIDKMVDSRLMSSNEMSERQKNNKGGRRLFI